MGPEYCTLWGVYSCEKFTVKQSQGRGDPASRQKTCLTCRLGHSALDSPSSSCPDLQARAHPGDPQRKGPLVWSLGEEPQKTWVNPGQPVTSNCEPGIRRTSSQAGGPLRPPVGPALGRLHFVTWIPCN